ncbi:MAG TPA: Ig-like domain-containing protein, partial [Cellvibrionaceae bacterium]|nr:Ig-like domain-containing protein [Cellvibrionaceae bacterium]
WRWSAVATTQTQFIAGYILERESSEIEPSFIASPTAGSAEFVVKQNGLASGSNTLVLQAKDSNGQVGTASLIATNRPNTTPVITQVTPDFSQPQTDAITVQGYVSTYGKTKIATTNWSLTLPTANPVASFKTDASGNFSFDLPSNLLIPTGNLLTIKAVNDANQTGQGQYTFDFAPTKPSISLALKDGDTLSKAQLSGTLDLPTQQTAKLEISINNGSPQLLNASQTSGVFTLAFTTAGLKPADNTLLITATSNLGAVTQVQLQKIAVAPPTVTISAPSANQTVNGTVHITGTVNSIFALSTIQLAVDAINQANIINTAQSPNFDFAIPINTLSAGGHTATVTAVASVAGAAAFSGSQTRAFIYALPPKLNLATPVEGSTVTDFVSVSGNFDLGAQSLKALDLWINGAAAISITQYITGNQYNYYVSPSQLNDGINSVAVSITDSQGLSSAVKTEFIYKKPSVATLLLTPVNGGSASGDVLVSGKVYSAAALTSATLTTNNQTSKNILSSINNGGDFSVVMKSSEILGNTTPSAQGNSIRLSLNASSTESKSQATSSFTYFQNPNFVPGGDLVVINDLDPFSAYLSSANNREFALNLINYTNPGKPRAAAKQIVFDAEYGTASDNYLSLSKYYQDNNWSVTIFQTETSSAPVTTKFYKDIPSDVKVIFLWEPRAPFTAEKVAALKQFAQEGGRVVFMGEGPLHYSAIDSVENPLLKQLGTSTLAGKEYSTFSGALTVSATPHQLTTGIKQIRVNVPLELSLGATDFPLLTDADGKVVIAVTRIDGN